MGKVANAISMLQLLSNGRKYSIQELANILEVTPRMIRNYKEELEISGIFIETIRGPYGGYVLNQKVSIPNNRNYNAKLEGKELQKFNLLTKAIKEKRKVRITYYSFTKGDNDRVIHPYEMLLYENGWGVAAFCEVRNDLRHFELNRIKEYEILDTFYK